MNVLHLRILSPQRDCWQFRFWTDDENTAKSRDLAIKEIEDLIRQAEAYYYNGPARIEIGRRLFRWLDGPDGVLSRAIEDARHGDGPLVLAIHTEEMLAHLPWETMADDHGFLVEKTNPVIVPTRWHGRTGPAWPAPENRPLHTLFMAAAPEGGGAPLQFEVEEGRMFRAAEVQGKRLMELTVEESGCLPDLGELVSVQPAGTFDVFHLTGHAGHEGGIPVFYLEDETGQPAPATADQLAKAFGTRRPRVVFLSGCRTAQNPGHGEEQSLAESLIAHGIRAALGWGRPVRDDHAILAAEILYRDLATGQSLPAALAATWRGMIDKGADGWHLLRLHFDGAVPGPLVTAPGAKDRVKAAAKLPSERFLIPGDHRSPKVPGLEQFVGRRRLLQQGIRLLRSKGVCGLVLHGTGGLGKSSVVIRWADRLKHDFLMVPVVGLCEETTLTQALAKALPREAEDARQALQGAGDLGHRLAAAIGACEKSLLFVLDDFEQNQDLPHTGEAFAKVKPAVAPVLSALVHAVANDGHARLLITTRYQLPAASVPGLEQLPITPMDEADQQKRLARLAALYPEAARQPSDLLQRVISAAGGNHRLLEWLFKILDQPGLDHPALIAALEAKEAEFRENVFAATLCAALTPAARALLTALQVCEEPIPLLAAIALHTGPVYPATESAITRHLATCVAWGLTYVWEIDGQPHWLAAPFLRPILGEPPTEAAAAALAVLQKLWWQEQQSVPKARLLELHRLALAAGNHRLARDHAHRLCAEWLFKNRSREAAAIAARTLNAIAPQRDPRLLTDLARALQVLGDGDASAALFAEAAALHGGGDMDDEKAHTLFNHAHLLFQQGKLGEAEAIYGDQLLPYFTALGDAGLRERAIVQGQIADLLSAHGQPDDALHLLQTALVPVFEKLGDVRSRAITLGKIADILTARGQLDEALRIRREEELPVYEKFGDVRSRAVTMGKIADALSARGQLDEALSIRRKEELPVFENLGDVRARAVTQGKIADILTARGQLDEALRIRREEQLPVFEKLGDIRSRALTLGNIADVFVLRGQLDDALRIRTEEELPIFQRIGDVREWALSLGMIADILAAKGQISKALQLRESDQLPLLERCGDIRETALAKGKIASLLLQLGQVQEALSVMMHQELPVYEQLGDIRAKAITLGKISSTLARIGHLDEAIRLRREEVLPVLEKVGDLHAMIVGRAQLAQLLAARGRPEDRTEIESLLAWAISNAESAGFSESCELRRIADALEVKYSADNSPFLTFHPTAIAEFETAQTKNNIQTIMNTSDLIIMNSQQQVSQFSIRLKFDAESTPETRSSLKNYLEGFLSSIGMPARVECSQGSTIVDIDILSTGAALIGVGVGIAGIAFCKEFGTQLCRRLLGKPEKQSSTEKGTTQQATEVVPSGEAVQRNVARYFGSFNPPKEMAMMSECKSVTLEMEVKTKDQRYSMSAKYDSGRNSEAEESLWVFDGTTEVKQRIKREW